MLVDADGDAVTDNWARGFRSHNVLRFLSYGHVAFLRPTADIGWNSKHPIPPMPSSPSMLPVSHRPKTCPDRVRWYLPITAFRLLMVSRPGTAPPLLFVADRSPSPPGEANPTGLSTPHPLSSTHSLFDSEYQCRNSTTPTATPNRLPTTLFKITPSTLGTPLPDYRTPFWRLQFYEPPDYIMNPDRTPLPLSTVSLFKLHRLDPAQDLPPPKTDRLRSRA